MRRSVELGVMFALFAYALVQFKPWQLHNDLWWVTLLFATWAIGNRMMAMFAEWKIRYPFPPVATRTLLIGALVLAACNVSAPPEAHADLLQCNYPERCFFFDVVPGLGNIRGFIKRSPTEMESQHWQLEYGSGGLTINIGGSVPELNINGGAQAGVSVTLSWSGWVCPDERYECPEPTIIQTWNKERPKPTKAVPVRVRPIAALLGAPWPPVDDVNIPRGWMLESPPEPHPDYPGGPGPFPPPPPAVPPAPPADPRVLPPTVITGD